jgi:transcriptional regulator with XRE-family HTH domain
MLRRYRRERGLSGSELAASLGVTQGTISKMESGQLDPDLDFLSKFIHTLRVKQSDAAVMMRLAGVVPAGTTPDRVLQYLPVDFLHADFSRRRQETIAHAESQSKVIRVFNPLLIPGLLQTENYTRQVMTTGGVRGRLSIDRAVRARRRRQRLLQTKGKRFTFLTTEAALLTRVGSVDVLAEQFRFLKYISGTGQIKLGFVGFDAALSVLPPPGFYLLDRRVYIELPHGDLWLLERSHSFDTYRTLFSRLVENAAFGDAFTAKLDELLDRMQSS